MEEYLDNIDLQTVSMQTLAFIGDGIYSVYIRCYLSSISNVQTGKLHVKAIKYVSAKGQASIIDKIFDLLNDKEKEIYKRGRNTNIATVSKNVDVATYKKSTGYEALLGYLYLNKDTQRMEELIKLSIECIEGEKYE